VRQRRANSGLSDLRSRCGCLQRREDGQVRQLAGIASEILNCHWSWLGWNLSLPKTERW